MDLSAFLAFKYLVIETLKSLGGKIKKVIFPEDQETIKNGLKSIKQGNFQNSSDVSQVFNKCIIINVNGSYGVAKKEEIESDIIKKIKETKNTENEEIPDIIPISELDDYEEIEKGISAKKPIAEISKHFNDPAHKILINNSIRINHLYKNSKNNEAEQLKAELSHRYEEYGSKFSNLYNKGYLQTFLSKLYENKEYNDLDSRVRNFIQNEMRGVFFVAATLSIEEMLTIKKAISTNLVQKTDYIAIHSLGSAIPIAKEVLNDIVIPEGYYEPVLTIDKDQTKEFIGEFSKMIYTKQGTKFLELIKEDLF